MNPDPIDGEVPQVDKTVFRRVEAPTPAEDSWADSLDSSGLTQTTPGGATRSPVRRPVERTFQPNELLAGRYRIVRFIAKGAMGQVYEAEDLELREQLALKTLSPELAALPEAMERFRREIHLARRVTHPNVCRIFDLQRHEPKVEPDGSPAGPPVLFLTMELLEGETLSTRLRRDGPMGTEDALALLRQLVAGLQAAHEVGVVHRDFKSGNVMLVESARGLRAVITDFGLASHVSAGGQEEAALTGPGTMLGTPAYMAPEQVLGQEVTPAVDIYALGVVLYETICGRRPFQAKTTVSMMVMRLKHPPESPRLIRPDIDPRWESALLRCLEREPSARFAKVEDLIRALEPPPPPAAAPPARRKGRRLAFAAAGAAVLLIAVGLSGLAGRLFPSAGGPAQRAETSARRSAAILGFKNLSGSPEAAWLSDALRELLGTELAAGERLRIVSAESVARVKLELGVVDPDSMSAEMLARIHENLDAEVLLLGSYLAMGEKSGGKLRLDLSVLDAATGETLARLTETGSEAEFLELVPRVGGQLRSALGVAGLSSQELGGRRASQPRTTEAARLYAEGLAKLRLSEALAARELLEKAVAADPGFPLSHSALAAAWAALGYDRKARDEARRAFDLGSGLQREEQLSVEGRYREAMREWDRAVSVYGALWSFFPDDLEHGLRLAEVQSAAGRGQDALETIASLRELPRRSGEDPRIDLAAATAAASLSDFRRQLEAAGRAAAEGEKRGARLIVAQARMSEWWARRTLGELPQAVVAAAEAKRIYSEAGYRGGIALALNAMGTVMLDQGNLDGAFAADTEALEVFRDTGDQRRMSWSLNNLARVLRDRGQLASAFERFEESLAISRELGDKSGLARGLANAGRVLIDQGRVEEARVRFEESLALRTEIGEKRGIGGAKVDLGSVAWRRGQLNEARTRLRDAAAELKAVGDKQSLGFTLWYLANVMAAEGNLEGARIHHLEALALREAVGSRRLVEVSKLSLARLVLEEGKAAEAETAVRAILTEAGESLAGIQRSSALALLSRALLAQGRLEDARESAAQALEGAKGSELLCERLEVEIAAAAVRASGAGPAEKAAALGELRAIAADAGRAGLGGLELDARLAACQAMPQGDAGRSECLEAARKDALALGFGLLARHASNAGS